jgi:hypothetical protein
MKNRNECDRLSFKKRITKISSSKRRPNSSFGIPSSTNYTMNSLYIKKDKSLNLRKSQDISRNTQLNNSCYFVRKNKPRYYSIKIQKKGKNLLYEDSIKLKTKINKLKKELAILKSDNLKKTEEIKKRKKDIIIAINKESTFGNLKEENIISKLKDNYDNIKNKIKNMKENNFKLFNELKNINLFLNEKENTENIFLLKEKILQYNNNLKQNLEYNNKIFYTTYFNRDEFFSNHNWIENIQKQIEEKNKNIFLLKENILLIKKRYNKIEKERKKLLSYNSSLEKRNEKLLIDKKTREDFILQKPIILGKINDYEKKIKGIEDINKKNENEIIKLSNASKNILKQLKENKTIKPINYNKYILIEDNPYKNINQKIILLQSLIQESKDRQNEFIEIFEYYDDYVQQKEKYDIINNEAKMIEEKNFININNNNNENNINNNENNNDVKITDESLYKNKDKENSNDYIINNNENDIEKNIIINNEQENKNDKNEENIINNEQENILNNSPSSINSKNNKEKENLNENEIINENENIEENKEEIYQEEPRERIQNNKKEKKYKNFQFLLSITFLNQGLQKEKIEKIIKEKNSDMDEDNYLLNISKNILSLINNKNEKDIKTLTKIFKNNLKEKYLNNINTFIEKIIPDFLEENKFNLIKSEEDENLYLSKIIQLYGPVCNTLIEKLKNFQNDNNKINLISYQNLKNILKEEYLYSNDDKEKKNIFKFFIFVLKKNISNNNPSNSINDFIIDDVFNFFKGISDVISGKKIESDDINEDDDGLTITDEDFKKIMNGFLNELNQKLEEKNEELENFLGEENIKEIENDGKNIKVMDIYRFVEKLRENDINLTENLVISCIFNRYQVAESSEDINIIALKHDLEKKQVIL